MTKSRGRPARRRRRVQRPKPARRANGSVHWSIASNSWSGGWPSSRRECQAKAARGGLRRPGERALVDRIEQLERRLAELEARMSGNGSGEPSHALAKGPSAVEPAPASSAPVQAGGAATAPRAATEDRAVLDFFRDTTINLTVDGYYGYNFNKTVGRLKSSLCRDASSR